jgi:hypothetical protein
MRTRSVEVAAEKMSLVADLSRGPEGLAGPRLWEQGVHRGHWIRRSLDCWAVGSSGTEAAMDAQVAPKQQTKGAVGCRRGSRLRKCTSRQNWGCEEQLANRTRKLQVLEHHMCSVDVGPVAVAAANTVGMDYWTAKEEVMC